MKYKSFWVTLIYAVIVISLAGFHEVWRDEVVPLSNAVAATSFSDMLNIVRNCGHPSLWYILLYFAYMIYPHFVVLKIVNLTLSIGGVWIFLAKAPFQWRNKILFILGMLPLYIYPVINRNYGISMLLLFLTASLYKNRFKNVIPFALSLALLANAHSHSLIIVFAICASLLYEIIFTDKRKDFLNAVPKFSAAILLILAGIAFCIYQIIPDNAGLSTTSTKTSAPLVESLIAIITHPGQFLPKVLGFKSAIITSLVLAYFFIAYLRKIPILIIYTIGTLGLTSFFALVFPSDDIRHQASVFLLIVTTAWMHNTYEDNTLNFDGLFAKLQNILEKSIPILLSIIFILQIFPGIRHIKEEVKRPFSNAKIFAQLIDSNPNLKEAIIVAEPDAVLESLPYYLENKTFYTRQNEFTTYRKLISYLKHKMSLQDFLHNAQRLKREHNKPVVILLGHDLNPQGPYQETFSHWFQEFTYSVDMLNEFNFHTSFLASFDNAIENSENYKVYLLK